MNYLAPVSGELNCEVLSGLAVPRVPAVWPVPAVAAAARVSPPPESQGAGSRGRVSGGGSQGTLHSRVSLVFLDVAGGQRRRCGRNRRNVALIRI